MISEYDIINDAVAQDISEYNNWDIRCQKYSVVLWFSEGSGKVLCLVLGIIFLQIVF